MRSTGEALGSSSSSGGGSNGHSAVRHDCIWQSGGVMQQLSALGYPVSRPLQVSNMFLQQQLPVIGVFTMQLAFDYHLCRCMNTYLPQPQHCSDDCLCASTYFPPFLCFFSYPCAESCGPSSSTHMSVSTFASQPRQMKSASSSGSCH